jgi:HSP20 family protein
MKKDETKLAKPRPKKSGFPAMVEAEKMFDKLAEITKETAAKAFDLFVSRGSQFGSHMGDWLLAEAETLRAAPVKITETAEMVNVAIAAPGFKPDEIEVSVKDDLLIVSGETKAEEKKEDENTFYTEWRSNRFMRKLVLPSNVRTGDIDATLTDGILTLSLKKEDEEKAVKVAVKAA